MSSFKALALDHHKDIEYAMRFPPAYDMNSTKLFKQFCDNLESALPKGTRIFTGYDCLQHIRLFTINTDNILDKDCGEANCKGLESNEVVLFLNEIHGVVCVLKLIGEGVLLSEEDILKGLRQYNVFLKTLVSMFCKELKYSFLYGGLVLPGIQREDLSEKQFLCLNGDYLTGCNNDGLVFITKDDLRSVKTLKSWWNRLLKKVKDERQMRMAIKPSTLYKSNFRAISSQVLASMTLVSGIQRITKSLNGRLVSLLLSNEQLKIVYDGKKLKLIEGTFGSGKSIILKAIAKKILQEHSLTNIKTTKDHGRVVPQRSIVYVCWDPYSLMEADLTNYFDQLFHQFANTQETVTLRCINFKALAEETGLEISDLLQPLGDKRKTFAKFLYSFCKKNENEERSTQQHLLIDEFPGTAVDGEVSVYFLSKFQFFTCWCRNKIWRNIAIQWESCT